MPQIVQGLAKFGQQGGRAAAVQQRQNEAEAAANRQGPGQRQCLIQSLQHGITPELLADPPDQSDHHGHCRATQAARDQGYQAQAKLFHQVGSVANLTVSFADFEAGTVLMQARTTFPFTSISQAPQLPPRQPVGMLTPAAEAATSQSLPTVASVVVPLGHCTVMVVMAPAAG